MAMGALLLIILHTIFSVKAVGAGQNTSANGKMLESYNSSSNSLTWDTKITRVMEGGTFPLKVNVTCRNCSEWSKIYFEIEDKRIAKVVSSSNNGSLTQINGDLHVAAVNITGIFIGMTSLHVTLMPSDDITETFKHQLFVARPTTALNLAFNYLLTALIVFANITFGCELDLQQLKNYFRKPFGILTGLFCQFGFMPAIAVGSSLLSGLNDVFAFGLLAYGCSPGGGSSNVWSVLLGGDINLSVAMTFSSFILSFAGEVYCIILFSAMMPLWLYTAGRRFSVADATIPYASIVMSLSILFVPTVIGMIIRRIKVKAANAVVKYIRPLVVVTVLAVVAIGIYLNRFLFVFMSRLGYRLVLPSLAIPYFAFLVSLIAAVIVRQTWTCAKTIAIEAGIQNIQLAIVLLRNSLPSPQSEISTVPALVAGLLASLPLFAALIGRLAYKFFRARFCPPPEEEVKIEGEVNANGISNPSAEEVEIDGEVNANGISNPSFSKDEETMVTEIQTSNMENSEETKPEILAQTDL